MPRGPEYPCSPEVSRMQEDHLLYEIDYSEQAKGCAIMYSKTGDIDWELRRIEAQVLAERQERIFLEIARLELLAKKGL